MKKWFFSICFVVLISVSFAAPWNPPIIVTPDHPRILFTSADSAEVHARLSVAPWSSYYSSIWSRANSTSGNASEVEDMNRARIAMSAGFVLYFNYKPGGDTLTLAERSTISDKAIDYLNNMLDFTGDLYYNGDYHYPSERLIMYSVAYDLLKGAGYDPPSGALANLADEIYDNATFYFLGYIVDNTFLFANHKLLVSGGLGTAAVAMPENGNAEDWINYAMTKMNHVTFTEETDPLTISGFAEGPHYLKYSLEHMDMWFMGMKHYIGDATYEYIDPCGGEETANIRCPWYDLRWDKIYEWVSSIRLPDGTLPPEDDAFRNLIFCMAAPFAERNPDFYWNSGVSSSRIYIYPMMVACGADTAGPMPAGLTSLPDAGNLIYRSEIDNGGLYFHYLAEHGIANTTIHNQSDAASYILHAHGENLAIDAGYIQYDERGRVNKVDNHNTILVNGGGPLPAATPAECYIDKAFEIPGLYYGEVTTNYSSADIERRSCMLGEKFICMIDDLTRSSSAEFTFQCHGWGLESESNFTRGTNSGLWTEGSPAYLRTVVDAPDGLDEIRYENSTHETGYMAWADHTVLRADKSGTDVRIIALLYPFNNLTGHDLRYYLPSISGQATIRFGAAGKEGVIMAATSTRELTLPPDSELPQCQGFGESAIFLIDSATQVLENIYVTDADSARYNGELIFVSSSRRDIGLYYQDDSLIRGYLNDYNSTISIPSEHEPSSVEGVISYDWDGDFINLQVPEDGEFTIDMTPLGIDEMPKISDNSLVIYPNPGSGHFNIRLNSFTSFEIFDINGRTIDRRAFSGAISSAEWQAPANIKNGIYLIKIRHCSGKEISRRFYIR